MFETIEVQPFTEWPWSYNTKKHIDIFLSQFHLKCYFYGQNPEFDCYLNQIPS